MTLRRLPLAVGLLAVLLMAAPTAHAKPKDGIGTVRFTTVPPIKGLLLRFPDGQIARTGSRGTVSVRRRGLSTQPRRGADRFTRLEGRYYRVPDVQTLKRADGSVVRFDRRYIGGQFSLKQFYRFEPRFVRQDGAPVPPGIVESYTLKSRTGEVKMIKGTDPVMLQGTRVVSLTGRLVSKDIEWALQSVKVDGTNVVTRARHRFSPRTLRGALEVPLLFFSAKITSTDAIFGSPIGHSVTLTYPNGRKRIVQLSKNGESNLSGLPRGNFTIKANAPGVSPERPLALSRDQVVDLKVISYLDLGLVAALLGAIAILLLVVRRPNLRRLKRRGASDAGTETAGTAAPEPAAVAAAAVEPAAVAEPAAPEPAVAVAIAEPAVAEPAVAEPAETRPARLEYFAASACGPRHAQLGMPNEDAWKTAEVGGGVIVAVADGMGSSPHAAVGARTACRAAVAATELWWTTPEAPAHTLPALIESLWREWIGPDAPDDARATCLVAGVASDGTLVLAALGDGVVLVAGDETERVLTDERTGFGNETHALGGAPSPRVWRVATGGRLAPGDIVLLATNGVADDLIAQRRRDFARELVRAFGGLPNWQRGVELWRALHDWPTPGHNDDKTVAVLWRP